MVTVKVVTVLGARPQFIKAAVVSKALRSVGIEEIVVHTGQHYDANMSSVFFRDLGMDEPDYNLGIGSGPQGAQTGRMLEAVETVLASEQPRYALVYGDTNSTLAGALAAAKMHIPVAHVEAGLRSFNHRMPEEINRVVTDVVSDLLFAPTNGAVANLVGEGISTDKIHLVGDVMFDVAIAQRDRARAGSSILSTTGVEDGKYVLATVHRAENTDDADRLSTILRAFKAIARTIPVVFPIHPRTQERLTGLGVSQADEASIHFISPVGYIDMVRLELGAAVIATDSGGVQKEAFFHKVPCVTLRDETEWTELISLGWNRLAPPTHVHTIVDTVLGAIDSQGVSAEPYGTGDAAKAIASIMSETLRLD